MTRQVSILAAQAFVERRTRKISSNTHTFFDTRAPEHEGLFLFMNRIAWYDPATDVPYVSFCGWATRTTLCRINHVIGAMGVQGVSFNIRGARGKKAVLYMNGVEHDPGEPIALVGMLGAIALKFERVSSTFPTGRE